MTVDFTDTDPDVRLTNAVKKYAVAWEPFANIKFRFVERVESVEKVKSTGKTKSVKKKEPPPADICIKFVDLPNGSSTGPPGQDGIAMCLEKSRFLNGRINEPEFGRVAIHEFGHALGAEHEHQRPDTGIDWNRAGVKAAFEELGRRTKREICEDDKKGPNWGCEIGADDLLEDDISNVNTLALAPAAHRSAYDRLSIMHYPIPAGYTRNNPEILIPPNMFLSKIDKDWIARYYPHLQREIASVSFDAQPDTPKEIAHPRPTLGAQEPRRTGGLVSLKVTPKNNLHVGTVPVHIAKGVVTARVDFLVTPSDDRRFKVGTFEKVFTRKQSAASQEIKFDRPFLDPDPVVIVWLDSIHSDHRRATKIKAHASHVTTEGFTIHLDPAGDSLIMYAGASWVAYPKDTPGVQTGNIVLATAVRNSTVPFIDGTFTQHSKALIAVNQLDFAAGQAVDFTVVANGIDDHGMNLKVDPHVGATYLALAPAQAPVVE